MTSAGVRRWRCSSRPRTPLLRARGNCRPQRKHRPLLPVPGLQIRISVNLNFELLNFKFELANLRTCELANFFELSNFTVPFSTNVKDATSQRDAFLGVNLPNTPRRSVALLQSQRRLRCSLSIHRIPVHRTAILPLLFHI